MALSDDGTPPEWIPLVPAGKKIEALDGRQFANPKPQDIVDAFNSDPRDLPVDWEHSSEIKAPAGEEAPAAGWVVAMEVRDGSVWGKVEWTPRGLASLKSREYRYISPAFVFDKAKKIIREIVSAALTNRPAMDMPAVARANDDDPELAAVWTTAYINDLPDSAFLLIQKGGSKDSEGRTTPRTLRHFPYKDTAGKIDLPHLRNAIARIPQARIPQLDTEAGKRLQEKARKLLEKAQQGNATAHMEEIMNPELLALLGLTEEATEDQIKEALTKLKAGPVAELEEVKKEMETARTKLTETETALANARNANPELDKFVPRADYDVAVARAKKAEDTIAESEKAAHQKEVDAEIDTALKAGKITPASKDFYVATCSAEGGLEKFRDFLKSAPVIGDPSSLDDNPPDVTGNKGTLTETELAVATNCGLTKEEFLEAKNAD